MNCIQFDQRTKKNLTFIVHDYKVLLVEQVSDFFCFLKGHKEAGETEVETAIRETKEETNLEVAVDSSKRFQVSNVQKKTIMKEATYLIVTIDNSDYLKADETEIKNIFWIDINKVEETLSLENIRALWRDVFKKINSF